MAMPYPGSGAPLAASLKLTAEGDKSNPFAYPFLMDIAKSLARNGLPPGFFLHGDSKEASIDLRAILLFEAGILKAPVRLMVPGKRREDKLPSLSLPALPDTGKQFPGDEQPAISSSSLGSSGISRMEETAKSSSPRLSLDFDRFQLELIKPQNKNELVAPETSPAMTIRPTSTLLPSANNNNSFRFWTLRPQGPPLAPFLALTPLQTSDYQGSFILALPGAISSIEGRLFGLKHGGVLASSRGKSLVLDSALCQITVAPGASLTVDNTDKGLLVLHVLETDADSVSIKFKAEGKLEVIRLTSGEQLVWSENPLSAAQRSLLSAPLPGSGNQAPNWAKGKFSPAAFADKSQFFKGEVLRPNSEFRSALKSLRGRLK